MTVFYVQASVTLPVGTGATSPTLYIPEYIWNHSVFIPELSTVVWSSDHNVPTYSWNDLSAPIGFQQDKRLDFTYTQSAGTINATATLVFLDAALPTPLSYGSSL